MVKVVGEDQSRAVVEARKVGEVAPHAVSSIVHAEALWIQAALELAPLAADEALAWVAGGVVVKVHIVAAADGALR